MGSIEAGRYALAEVEGARLEAARMSGLVCPTSPPRWRTPGNSRKARAISTSPSTRGRKVLAGTTTKVHYADLTAEELDARRYNWIVTHWWLVLRITWDIATLQPQLIRDWLTAAVLLRRAGHAA